MLMNIYIQSKKSTFKLIEEDESKMKKLTNLGYPSVIFVCARVDILMSEFGEIFRKISYGARFDFKKYKKDAELFSLLSTSNKPEKLETDVNVKQESIKKSTNDLRNIESSVSKHPDKSSEISEAQVFGDCDATPISCFSETILKIPDYLSKSMMELNYLSPTPIQKQAIPILLKNYQVLACAPTGSGKTLAYLFPILCSISHVNNKNKLYALIVLPTGELAKQIYNETIILTSGSKIKTCLLSKIGTNSSKTSKSLKYNTYDIVISTPQRIIDHLNVPSTTLNLSSVEWLVFDEGDLLFTDGQKGFRNQIATIYNSCSNKNIKRCIFSATLGIDIESWAEVHLTNLATILIGNKDSAPETIKQELLFVGQESGKIMAVRNMIRSSLDPPILIFVNSILKAQELFRELIYDGINVEVMHSDKTLTQRNQIITAFRTGKIWVLITTDLMSRGIDFKGIKQVINYDAPSSHINYIHRIGRSGRAGISGSAITLFTENDISKIKKILPVLRASNAVIPKYLEENVD